MPNIQRVCVFCGSNSGNNQAYSEAARSLGTLLAKEGLGLVYGGGKVGLMGEIADAVLQNGGDVLGVIPKNLEAREVAHHGVTKLVLVETMHERKTLMAESADAFITMPGGFGTMEEFFEVVTWSLLGIHEKPIGLLNVEGYYDSLLEFIDRATRDGFVRSEHRRLMVVAKTPNELLTALRDFRPLPVAKWLNRSNL